MSQVPTKPYVLVPEYALLKDLPKHQQERFSKALDIMHYQLNEGLTWEQIAEKSAISAFHFHRQFTEMFNETPGRYLSRLRLQLAVDELLEAHHKSITDIAHNSGFSSSQALAKALKRELGLTAKEIRKQIIEGTPEQTSDLLDKLAHPGDGMSIEQQLAKSLPCEVIWYPDRWINTDKVPDLGWDDLCVKFGKEVTKVVTLTPISDIDKAWKDIQFFVGEACEGRETATQRIPEGHYLCAEVYLVSDSGYAAALEGLFEKSREMGLDLDIEGYLVELIRDVELTLTGGATFSFQIPIKN